MRNPRTVTGTSQNGHRDQHNKGSLNKSVFNRKEGGDTTVDELPRAAPPTDPPGLPQGKGSRIQEAATPKQEAFLRSLAQEIGEPIPVATTHEAATLLIDSMKAKATAMKRNRGKGRSTEHIFAVGRDGNPAPEVFRTSTPGPDPNQPTQAQMDLIAELSRRLGIDPPPSVDSKGAARYCIASLKSKLKARQNPAAPEQPAAAPAPEPAPKQEAPKHRTRSYQERRAFLDAQVEELRRKGEL